MKRKLIFLVVVTFFVTTLFTFAAFGSTPAKAALAIEKVSTTDATVTADKLNIRQGPSVSFPVLRVLEKGQALKVLSKVGNWYAVYDLKNGFIGAVDGRYINLAGESQASANVGKTAEQAAAEAVLPSDVSEDEQALLELVNKARKDAKVEAVAFDKKLLTIARQKAKDMAENNYFSHESPTFGSPFDMMRQNGITFKTAGENIAGNQTVEGAFKAWMKSDGHKKNILNSGFNFVGIGIVSSDTYGKILVQQFIGR
ncbi:MAG: SCP-like extracellular protein [Ruminiclostridium sp.]|nr:SCP-like extracellular protein [Ruminiclostridium sp.]